MGTSNLVLDRKNPFQGWITENRKRKHFRKQRKLYKKHSSTLVTLEKLHSNIRTFPNWSILLGQCKDGLPFLLDLSDPAVGPILISGDEGCGKTHHLEVLVGSAIRTHKPSELQFSILTHNPHDWDYLQQKEQYGRYLQDIHAWYDGRAEEKIQSLTELAEARREGKENGQMVMLILDDLNFIEDLSYEAQVNLRWLISYGAQANIWIIAAIKSNYAKRLSYWLEPFRTRILGRIQSMDNAQILAIGQDSKVRFMEPTEFKVWSGTSWMTYRLPLLGG